MTSKYNFRGNFLSDLNMSSKLQGEKQCESRDLLPIAMGQQPIRVVYIVGAGRSGSTVLDTCLGDHPEVIGVGELCNLHQAGWTKGEYCACGNPGNECEFWGAVLREWKRRDESADVAEYIKMQNHFESFRFFGWIQWLRLFKQKLHRTRQFRRYLKLTRNLYQAICAVSGKSIVVDSSKNPVRAMLLSKIPEIDLRIVHLVRDGRAVAWSRKKALQKNQKAGVPNQIASRPIWYSVVYWLLVNVMSGLVRKAGSRKSTLVRYEDFVSNPDEALNQIAEVAELDLSGVANAIVTGEVIPVGHLISGNRLRMAGKIQLQADWEWMQKLPSRDRRVCWTLAGWMLRRYRYDRSAATTPSTPHPEEFQTAPMTSEDIIPLPIPDPRRAA